MSTRSLSLRVCPLTLTTQDALTGETQADVRRDLRNHRVFTIDPETAKDLDDALHIVKNEDGTYEVGVHIADVSHFVKVSCPNFAFPRLSSLILVLAFTGQHSSRS